MPYGEGTTGVGKLARGERPLDDGDHVLLRFAADLRALREKAGKPPYRVLAGRANYSVAALSTAAAGRRLPTLSVTLAYVGACGGDTAEWERRWHAVAAELAGPELSGSAMADDDPPYVGLAAFRPEDADRFFGRERLVEELAGRLSRARLLAVFGASGAGKSSLLGAGLLPRWTAGTGGPAALFTPGSHPLEECAVQLARLTGLRPGELRAELAGDPRGLHRLTRLALAGRPGGAGLLLVVDQFEEVFTLCDDEDERTGFIQALITAARAGAGGCRVVLGVRADFYAHCSRHPDLLEVINDAQLTVGPMTADELRLAIAQPAARAGCSVESALLTTLVAEVRGEVGGLPSLSHALLETWRRRRGNALTLAGFQATGGLRGALAQTAESLYTTLTPERQRLLKSLFKRLTAPGDGTGDTKRRISRSELDAGDHDTAAILERLAAARLLTLDRDSVQISHEALIECWPRLRDWLAEDREGLRVHRRLTEAADAWEATGRDPGALYRGLRLAQADSWNQAGDTVLTVREREFLDSSLSAQRTELAARGRRTRRLRQFAAAVSILLVLACTATVYAVGAHQDALRQRNTAVSQKIAAEADTLRTTDPALTARLGLAAYRLMPTAEARGTVLSSMPALHTVRLTGHTDNVNAIAYSPDGRTLASASWDRTVRLWKPTGQPLATLTGHTGNVNGVAFSPGGRVLASAGWDRTVRLWDLTGLPLAVITGHSADVNAVAFSPDGRTLASASSDRVIRLWDVSAPRAPRPLGTLTGHTDGVVALAFAPGGRTLASAGWDHTVRLWDLTGSRRSAVLSGHTGPVLAVAFSPDGQLLASTAQDATTRLWSVAGDGLRTARVGVLRGHDGFVRAVAFGPRGRTLATTGHDRTTRLWDVSIPRSPRPLVTLTGQVEAVVAVAFGPAGRSLATSSDDHTIWVRDLQGPALVGHTGAVCATAFSPDGRTLATGGRDRTARLWDVAHPLRPAYLGALTGHRRPVCGVAFSPDGRRLATAGDDGVVRLWDVIRRRRPELLATLASHGGPVSAVAFGPGGGVLATAGYDRTARLWDVTDARRPVPIARLTGHADAISKLAFSPDGALLATASYDRTARLWRVADPSRPALITRLSGHADAVNSVAFSPGGTTLATAGYDRTTRLWDVTDPSRATLRATLTHYANTVHAVAFSRDGRTLATATADHDIQLWDVADPRIPAEVATLAGHAGAVNALAFAPDGRTLASAGQDHAARLWNVVPEQVAALICEGGDSSAAAAEWERHVPGLPYRPVCGSGP